jgi:hypothetical protein
VLLLLLLLLMVCVHARCPSALLIEVLYMHMCAVCSIAAVSSDKSFVQCSVVPVRHVLLLLLVLLLLSLLLLTTAAVLAAADAVGDSVL